MLQVEAFLEQRPVTLHQLVGFALFQQQSLQLAPLRRHLDQFAAAGGAKPSKLLLKNNISSVRR